MNKLLLWVLALLCLSSVVLAAQPQVSPSDLALEIAYPKQDYFELGDTIKLHFHIFNSTGSAIVASALNCSIHVYGFKNEHLLSINASVDSNGVDSYVTVNDSYLNKTGVYPYIFWCSTSSQGSGFVSSSFEVTVDGKETSANGIAKFILLFVIGFSLFVVGRVFRDYTTGILGGFFIFLLGLYTLIHPLVGFADWLNLLVGSVFVGFGAYVFIVGSIEVLKED